MAKPPRPSQSQALPAYALGAVLAAVVGLFAAELSFVITRALTGRGWADGEWWQYAVAGLAFIAAGMVVVLWVRRRIRQTRG